MKTLYIAEKPDIAASMAAYLWPNDYKSLKDKHCYTKGDTTVTWAYGHILMLCMPEPTVSSSRTSRTIRSSL